MKLLKIKYQVVHYSKTIVTLLILIFTLTANNSSAQQVLYSVGAGVMRQYDPGTGTFVNIAPIPSSFGQVSSLTYNPTADVYYCTSNVRGMVMGSNIFVNSRLLEWNPCSLSFTVVDTIVVDSLYLRSTQSYQYNVAVTRTEGLSYNPVDGLLYASVNMDGSTITSNLIAIDPGTGIGAFQSIITGTLQREADYLEFVNNVLYCIEGGPVLGGGSRYHLYTLDISSGQATQIDALSSITGAIGGLGYSGTAMYLLAGANTSSMRLSTIDLANGVVTPVNPLGTPVPQDDGLSFGPPPTCCPYEIVDVNLACADLDSTICIPFNTTGIIQNGIIGIDFCMDYNPAELTPTGNVFLGPVVLNGSTNAGFYINHLNTPGQLHVSVYYDPTAPPLTNFVGAGEIACVEFAPNSGYVAGTASCLSVCEVVEGFQTSVEFECGNDGCFTLSNDTALRATIVYWDDISRPLQYDVSNPNTYVATHVSGTDLSCNVLNSNVAQPDLNGEFTYPISNGPSIQIIRDMDGQYGSVAPCPAPTGVMQTINGMDAFFTGLVTTLNSTFVPNPYQIVAMDVNMDGFVSANDITHIQNRTIGGICEFPQAWNYTPTPGPNSLDWRFIDRQTVLNDADYTLSATYPSNDGLGYSRYRVPNVPFCLEVPTDNNGICTLIPDMEVNGILLGDPDGSWNNGSAALLRASGDQVIFDLDGATKDQNCVLSVPVYYESTTNLMALDFAMDYDDTRLKMMDVAKSSDASAMSHAFNNMNDDVLMLTSYSYIPGGLNTTAPVFYLRFKSSDGKLSATDLGGVTTYINGVEVQPVFKGSFADCATAPITNTLVVEDEVFVAAMPNPFNDVVQIVLKPSEGVINQIALFDLRGRMVMEMESQNEVNISLSTSAISKGVYMLFVNGKAVDKLIK